MTSNVIGDGSNSPIIASRAIDTKLIRRPSGNRVASLSSGTSVAIAAPNTPARIINGTVILIRYQRLRVKLIVSQRIACGQPSFESASRQRSSDSTQSASVSFCSTVWLIKSVLFEICPDANGGFSQRVSSGIPTNIKAAVVPIFRKASHDGNIANSIVSTITFKVGELTIAANIVSGRAPAA